MHRTRAAVALRWRPEWPLAVLIALAWIALLGDPDGHGAGAASEPAWRCDDRLQHGAATLASDAGRGALCTSSDLVAALPGWTLMAVAMMAPVTLPAVRHVGLNSVRRRRQWAMALYFAVYVAVWVVFGALALVGGRLLSGALPVDARAPLAVALAVAAAWQLTRSKRRALFACMRTVPLPPTGLRADAGCVRFALEQGTRCVRSCWALMVVMAVVGDSALVWMAALTALITVESLTLIGRRLLRPSAAVLGLAAGLVALGV